MQHIRQFKNEHKTVQRTKIDGVSAFFQESTKYAEAENLTLYDKSVN